MELSEVDKLLADDSDNDDLVELDLNEIQAALTLEEILNEDLDGIAPVPVAAEGETQALSVQNPLLHRALLKPRASTLNTATKSPLQVAQAIEDTLLAPPSEVLVSPLAVKRRMRMHQQSLKLRKETNTLDKMKIALQLKQKQSTGGSGVVKVEPMQTISKQLAKNAEFRENGPGSPTVVAIHPKFIAIGTSKSLVLVFDHFQNIRHVLRNTSMDTNHDPYSDGAVTAIDVSPGSDFLVCGYQSGRIVLWDMLKGTSLKVVADAHDCPVVSLLFMKDQKPCILSVDANGIANKINFSKMMGYVYVVDTDPIYDGSAGKILSVAILPQSAGHAKIAHITDTYCIAAISTDKLTFLVAIEPEVRILHRWFKPDGLTSDNLPSLAFAWVALPGSSRNDTPTPMLARGWGKHVQFLEILFQPRHSHNKDGWPTFAETNHMSTTSDVVATQWLGDHVVMYLTYQDELCVYDTMSRQELEIVDVSSMGLVYASYRGNNGRSFANSFRACNDMLYLLGLKELQTARVQPWTQRIDALIEDGEWLEGLGLALDHFDGLTKAAATRAERDRFPPVFFTDQNKDQCVVDIFRMCQTNQRTGDKEDVFRYEDNADEGVRWCVGENPYSPDVSKRLEAAFQNARSGHVTKNIVPIGVAERVADLLMDYVRLAIGNAPTSSSTLDLAISHYQMLAGVAIEYCAQTHRTDLLFGDIFKRFQEVDKASVFVALLAPYILNDQLKVLSPVVMTAFVEHFQNDLTLVEKCFLHLNVRDVDFNTMLQICEQHSLYTALVYLYNEAKQDYTTPIDVLIAASGNATPQSLADLSEEALTATRGKRMIGYKCLLYISFIFTGKTFPKREIVANNPNTASRYQRMVASVAQHLFAKQTTGDVAFPRLVPLIQLDAKVFFEIMAKLFDDPNVEFEGEQTSATTSQRYSNLTLKCPSRMEMVLSLADTIVGTPTEPQSQFPASKYFSAADQGHFYMFEARLLSSGAIDAQQYATARSNNANNSQWVMDSLMHFLASGPQSLSSTAGDEDGFDKIGRQAMLVRLLQTLSPDSYDQTTLLRRVTRETMNRAAVVLHRARGEFNETISAYLADTDHEYKLSVFSYIRSERDKVAEQDGDASNSDVAKARQADIEQGIINHCGGLLEVDPHEFVVLILENFASLNVKIIQKFVSVGGKTGAKWEFTYLRQILTSAEGEDSDVIRDLLEREKTVLQMAEDPAVQERFIRLLCEFEPSQVFPYLAAHDSYKVETCLKLCKEFKITDAEAYLLERTGDVNGALTIILTSMEKQLKVLKPALRGFNLNTADTSASGWQQESIIESVQEGKEVMKTLDVAIAMCQRNSARHHDDQSEKLWFTLLDMCLKVQNLAKKSMQSKTKSRTSTRGAQTVFQVAVNELIRIILERMSSCVSLQAILFKITNEHGKDEFGDFRPTIFGMLDTYNYEHNIYQTANALIRTDLHDQVMVLRRAQAKCIASASVTCHYCKVVLSKPPFGMGQHYNSKEKWNRHTSSVSVKATGQLFHDSCAKMWEQELDKKEDHARKAGGAHTRTSTGSQDNEGEAGDDENQSSSRSLKRQGSTRRYLSRLKRVRDTTKTNRALHHLLASLNRVDGTKNKYLRGNTATFSLKPASLPKVSRQGPRKPGVLPAKANKTTKF
ncbi:vacuolar protein sorting-associated protein 8 [Thraustotheca clavata]|uniref:Vacuolar protein sorting-associated protein 8 n=1 Tax=Thraustotheca clavata TaxID=74557 RepID=A0A1V9ZXG1_9STRA|nr:vacuolar protein sorting-associated protein 8 [Thraustotheca clavata]